MARAYGSSAHLLMKRETTYGQAATGDMGADGYSSSPTRVIRSSLTSWTTSPITPIPMELPTAGFAARRLAMKSPTGVAFSACATGKP